LDACKNIGIFCKPSPPATRDILRELTQRLRRHGCRVFMDRQTSAIVGETSSYEKVQIPPQVDLVIVLGGDGTLLSVARITHPFDLPVLAVNLGTLGFLTEFTPQDLYEKLDKVLRGDFQIENRMLLNARLWRGSRKERDYNVLNEVVINGGALSRIVNLEVHVNDQYMTSYRADGLIIATPTGSTAHSLSAGGPIIHPRMHALVLSPICPFALTNRPIVIPDDSEIKVMLATVSEDIRVTLDGQEGCDMKKDDVLSITKAENCIQLVKSPARSYYKVLREKLHWGREITDDPN